MTEKFLTNLTQQYCGFMDRLDTMLTQRYLSKRQEPLFAMVKPSESGKTLNQRAKDVFVFTRRFALLPPAQD